MIVVRLKGGLGNQMFQYAAGRRLAERNGDELLLDLTFLLDRSSPDIVPRDYGLDIFDNLEGKVTLLSSTALRLPAASTFCRRASRIITRVKSAVGAQRPIVEGGLRFHEGILCLTGNVYLDGYWQSERYFSDIEPLIRDAFRLPSANGSCIRDVAAAIESTNAVCLNVRRGDFVHHPGSAKAHGFVGAEYYYEAVQVMTERVTNPHFFIFSDDLPWCRANLALDSPHSFVDHDCKGPKFRDYLHLMSLCKHFLIANSTFAWWAVWLNPSAEKIVIAPKRWFADPALDGSDICLPSWIRI